MADLLGVFKDKAEAVFSSINSEGGVRGAIEGLRRKMAEADRKRAIQRLKRELTDIERQIGELLTSVGVQAVALKRANALSSPELEPLCDRIIDLEALLQEQKQELARIEAEAQAQRAATEATAIKCAQCGAPLPAEGEFCPHCGAPRAIANPQPAFCAHCGAPLREGARFCPHCGKESPA